MSISVRRLHPTQPAYSLTADVQNFLQCGLQYRYARTSRLPWSDSPQLWFGRFVCDCLQVAEQQVRHGLQPQPPWDPDRISQLCSMVTTRLQAEQIVCRSRSRQQAGLQCVTVAINELGPLLFPLIDAAQVPVSGSRWFPTIASTAATEDHQPSHFVLTGTVPALLRLTAMDRTAAAFPLRQELLSHRIELAEGQTILVDFKSAHRPDLHRGSRRAATAGSDADQWRALVLSWLLAQQTALPAAAVVVYLHELSPSAAALRRLRQAQQVRTAHVLLPHPDSPDAALLQEFRDGHKLPQLSRDFRLQRAFRVIPVTPAALQTALQTADHAAQRIQTCRNQEAHSGRILSAWERNSHSPAACNACRARTWCPDFRGL